MKYISTILVFAFTGTILWTIGNFSAEMEELKVRKVEVDNIKIYTKEERQEIKQANKAKSLRLKNNTALQNERSHSDSEIDHSLKKPYAPLTLPKNLLPDLFQDQTEVNVVIKDYKGLESNLMQEPSSSIDTITENYKKSAITRISSSVSLQIKKSTSKIENKPAPTPTSLINDTTLISDDGFLNKLNNAEQNHSNTSLENHFENFNFSKQEKLNLSLKTETTNGKILPNTRLTIENSQGQILLEGSTNIEGRFKKELIVFTGEKIYVRYYGVGISQEKNEITKQGEE